MTEPLKIKFKKLSKTAKAPQQNKGNCFDLFANTTKEIDQYEEQLKGDGRNELYYEGDYKTLYFEAKTGLAVEIPEGYIGLLFPRSSISNTNFILANSVGVIDSSFRGEITFRFRKLHNFQETYYSGSRIGQILIIPHPEVEFVESEELSETNRGTGGFGSTGR
jgi:dUTP pyrophosphatase